MMSYSVVVTESAERDLAGIVDYVSGHLSNPKAAFGIVEEFERLVESLEKMPAAHAVVRDELLASVGYRWSSIGSYLVFFTIDEEAAIVNVERVLHGTMNWREIV